MSKSVQLKDKEGPIYPIIRGKVLYNNEAGSTNINISDFSGIESIDVYVKTTSYDRKDIVRIDLKGATTCKGNVIMMFLAYDPNIQIILADIVVNGSNISLQDGHYGNLNRTTGVIGGPLAQALRLTIYKIIGYY